MSESASLLPMIDGGVVMIPIRQPRRVFVGEGICWQCGHSEERHTVEDRGCTHPECACAQVPEA